MKFTKLGKELAEKPPVIDETGATAHMKACQFDSGQLVILTGHDVNGRRIRREAHSIFGAFMTMKACWGLERAWLVTPAGRRLVIVR